MEIEKAILGSLLLNNNQFYLVSDHITEADFFFDQHKNLFSHLALRIPAGEPVTILTLNQMPREKVDAMGGIAYIAQLPDATGNVPMTPRLITHYATRLKRAANLRKLALLSTELAEMTSDPDADPSDIVQACQDRFLPIIANSAESSVDADRVGLEIEDRLQSYFSGNDPAVMLHTGFLDIDKQIRGFRRRDLVILAARPSVGKSALMGNLLDLMSRDYRAGCASLEMSRHELYLRILAKRLACNMTNLELGRIPVAGQRAVFNASFDLRKHTFWIDDGPSQTIAHIANTARRAKVTAGLDVLFVDYLQLVRYHAPKNLRYDRKDIVAEVTHGLKALAKDLDIAVVALAQLNREVHEDNEPGLHNLRECGDIEQDADLVMFLWLNQNVHTLTVAKNRNGARGARIPLTFIPERVAFYDFAQENR